MNFLTVTTKHKRQVIDVTDDVQRLMNDQAGGVVHLFVLHTTAALSVADLDPGTDLDMLDAFEALIPKLKYRHPHDPAHMPDHILSTLIGVSLTLPVEKGKLALGAWQRAVLFEFDGPRERKISVTFVLG